jgi:hypothetical protein
VVTPDDIVGHVLGIARVQQFLDHGFVPDIGASFQLISGCAKTGSAHQVGHQS